VVDEEQAALAAKGRDVTLQLEQLSAARKELLEQAATASRTVDDNLSALLANRSREPGALPLQTQR
jgi:hypothetical protein